MNRHNIFLLALALSVTMLPFSCDRKAGPGMDWEQVISSYADNDSVVDCRKLAVLNLALAETGRLTTDMFSYTQAGGEGLFPSWDKNEQTGKLLSDIFYSAGFIAQSQRMAFEANVLTQDEYDPDMMLRLTQTNIIFGAYPVAEKYIRILEKDRKYSGKASSYRRFLYDDAAVEADPELGERRKCIPREYIITCYGEIDGELKAVIAANPAYHKAVEYLGAYYLLECRMDDFKQMVDEYYGTETLPRLDGAFAEAACLLSNLHYGWWRTVGVSPEVNKRYRDMISRMENGLDVDRYKGTFWYYYLRTMSSYEQQ